RSARRQRLGGARRHRRLPEPPAAAAPTRFALSGSIRRAAMVDRTSSPDARLKTSPVAKPTRAFALDAVDAPTDVVATAIGAVLFAVALIHALWAMRIGWDNGIYDAFGFRQTQTAMSTYYMLHGGPLFAYETPLFGYPWAIPIEFPLYQWIVAGLVAISGLP